MPGPVLTIIRQVGAPISALFLLGLCGVASLRAFASDGSPDPITLSIVATTDVHGFVFPRDGRGGVALFGGYLKNLRASRARDGGAVLLVDSGDTFQGGIESDLSEGALVVDAYNALGYTAAAIGNHEFEFGPVDRSGARQARFADPRGALKARAAQATFPFLAANLIDTSTGRPVDWPNVRPSVIVEAAGVKVGIIGVMTIDALRSTLPVNVRGLGVAPLAPAILRESGHLRASGATVVLVAAHAGGGCRVFADPADLSSCDDSSEIFQIARQLPRGTVDAIAAGHTHDAIAHVVDGVAIIQAYSLGRSFGRVDLSVDRRTHHVVGARPFAPREVCTCQDPESLQCDPSGSTSTPLPATRYEGEVVTADRDVDAAMSRELRRVHDLQAVPLGVVLDTPVRRSGDVESPLGNLFADALRAGVPGAEVAINNNSRGGLRTDLPAGALTFGSLYDVFPFDNRLVKLTVSGAELQHVVADEVLRGRRGALGVSGIRIHVSCGSGGVRVALFKPSGAAVDADERLVVVTTDTLASGQVFAPVASLAGFTVPQDSPILREVVEDWFRHHGGHLGARDFVDADLPRWEWPDPGSTAACVTR